MLLMIVTTPLSIGFKIATVYPSADMKNPFNAEELDRDMFANGLTPVGWRRLTKSKAFTARIYKPASGNSNCLGKVAAIAMPRNGEGVSLLKSFASHGNGTIIFHLDGRTYSQYPVILSLANRLQIALFRLLDMPPTAPVYGLASQRPCPALHNIAGDLEFSEARNQNKTHFLTDLKRAAKILMSAPPPEN